MHVFARASIFYLRSTLLSFLSSILLAVAAQANGERLPWLRDVGFDQRLNEQVPLELVFQDEIGTSVHLREYFGKTPVLLAFLSYECPRLCTLVLDALLKSLRVLSYSAGDQYSVVMVSFDPRETPALAATKKASALERYARPGAAEGWHFLTGEESSIRQLAEAVGFRYTYDTTSELYAHATGIMVLTPEGKIARYLYGIEYAPRDLRLALVEASGNRIGSRVDQVLLLCYQYDPAAGKYGVIVINVIRLGGIATLLALGTFLSVMFRRDRRLKTDDRG